MPDDAGTVLLERQREVAELRRHLLHACDGHGQVALVSADAGYGKSRLLQEVARHAAASGVVVLRGRAVPGCGPYRPVAEAFLGQVRDLAVDTPALRPFRAVLGRLLPGWSSEPLEPGGAVDPLIVMAEALIRLLREVGGDSGVLLALDDLHWSDPDTLAMLEYLSGALEGTGALVLGAARTDEVAPAALARLRTDPRVVSMRLGPLSQESVRDLAASRLGDRLPTATEEYVIAHADGSPLLTEELVDGLVQAGALIQGPKGWTSGPLLSTVVPRTLADVVTDRLRLMAPEERTAIAMAAVIGPSIRPTLIADAASLPVEAVVAALGAAAQQHLLVADPAASAGLRWRHALTRDAVLETFSPPERRVAAGRAALAVERAGSLEPDDIALAARLQELGGHPVQAARLNVGLARQAARGGALATAWDRLAMAERLSSGDRDLGVEIAAESVRVLASMGRVEDALTQGEAAIDAATADQRVELALALARAAVTGDRFAEAERVLSRHVPADDARSAALAAHAAFGLGRPDQAVTLARQAVRASSEASMPDVLCDALEILGRHARLTDVAASEAAFSQAHDVAVRAGLVPARIRALSELGILDGLRSADPRRLEQARGLAAEVGMLGTVAMLDLQVAACLTVRDGLSAAHRTASRAADTAERLRLDAVASAALMFVASGLLAQGRRSDMRRALERANELNGESVDVRVWGTSLVGMAALLDGQNRLAVEHFDAAVEVLRRGAVASSTAWWGVWVVLKTSAESAVPPSGEERPLALVQTANVASLAYARAIAAAAAGDVGESAREMTTADAMLEEVPHWRHLMWLLVAQAAAEGGWEDPVPRARACLAYFEEREPLFATLARNVLKGQGVPVPRRRRGAEPVPAALRALGVTGRETEVLWLLSESLTNAEIGRRLFLSPRTVETHVKHLMQKLGVGRRGELTAAAREHGVVLRSS